MPLLIDALRTHLMDAGLVRDPRQAGPLPPCWRSPTNGTPAPGDGTATERGDLVVAIYSAPGVPYGAYDAGVLRKDGIDIRYRCRQVPPIVELDDAIREVINDQRAYDLAGLTIVESLLERPLDMVYSDDQGFDFLSGYVFERHA